MNTTIDIIDRYTVSINFDSPFGNETVLARGDVYDNDIVLNKSDLISNPALSRCSFLELENAVKFHNSLPNYPKILLNEDDKTENV